MCISNDSSTSISVNGAHYLNTNDNDDNNENNGDNNDDDDRYHYNYKNTKHA